MHRQHTPARQFGQQGGQAPKVVGVARPVLVQGQQTVHAVPARLQGGQRWQLLAALLVGLFQRVAAPLQGVAKLAQMVAIAKQAGPRQQADQAGGQRSLAHALAALP